MTINELLPILILLFVVFIFGIHAYNQNFRKL